MTALPPPVADQAPDSGLAGAAALPTSVSAEQRFLLVALQPSASVGWRLVGRFPDYDSIRRAHIDDVLSQLDSNDGWLVRCEHLLIGPDLDGSIGCWPQLVSVGADPSSDRVPDPYDRAGWQQWLEHTQQLTPGTETSTD